MRIYINPVSLFDRFNNIRFVNLCIKNIVFIHLSSNSYSSIFCHLSEKIIKTCCLFCSSYYCSLHLLFILVLICLVCKNSNILRQKYISSKNWLYSYNFIFFTEMLVILKQNHLNVSVFNCSPWHFNKYF